MKITKLMLAKASSFRFPAVALAGLLVVGAQAAGAAPRKFIDIADGWRVQPMPIEGIKDKSVCPPPLEDPKEDEERSIDDLLNDDDLLGSEFAGSKKQAKSKSRTSNRKEAAKKGTYIGANGKPTNWLPKLGSLREFVPTVTKLPENAQQTIYTTGYNAWYERTVTVPAEWKGSLVTFDLDVMGIDLVVFVGTNRVGVISAPTARLDMSKALEYGKPNLVRVFATNCGLGTGTGGIHYRGRDENCKHFESSARLVRHTDAILDDVFVDTSYRQKKVTLHGQVFAKEACNATFSAVIAEDASGREVKTFTKKLALQSGTNTFEVAEDWADFTTWETERPFLYTCKTELELDDGSACEGGANILFGFREVWRVRGQIYMNGHIQSVRGFWGGGILLGDPDQLARFKAAGFNTVYQTHQHNAKFRPDQKMMETLAREGILLFTGAPAISSVRDAVVNPVKCRQYERFCEYWARGVRNWPSVIGVPVGVNMMCAWSWTMGARDMGKGRSTSLKGIYDACEFVKKYHPNCLAYAHGDGNICDLGNSNFYFNMVPLQEREEWYSDWYARRDRDDTIPYFPGEYGQPYYGSWFGGSQPSMTEFAAAYFGDEAYLLEDERMLTLSRDFAYSKAELFYGGYAPGEKQGQSFSLYDLNPIGRKFHNYFHRRVTRAWRAWHCRLAPQYLDEFPFFDPEAAGDQADRVRGEYETHAYANHPLCVFLGGDAELKPQSFADNTHAYRAGGKIRKSLVAIWDGLGEETVKAVWTFKDEAGKLLASGEKTIALKQSDVKFEPIEIDAPKVAAKTRCTLAVRFESKSLDPIDANDSMAIELHPVPAAKPVANAETLALFDPRGESAAAFDAMGLKYRKVASLDELNGAGEKCLAIGRRALDGVNATNALGVALAKLEAVVAGGKKLIVMEQRGDVLHDLGFFSDDLKPRKLFNVSLPGVDDDDLASWAGAPLPTIDDTKWQFAPDWGPGQFWHCSPRPWRWRHTHALAMSVVRIPQRMGFRPLVRGEFDMMYSPLLRCRIGKGSFTLCTFSFEGGRVGPEGDPAATRVMAATFTDYFAHRLDATGAAYVSGNDAKRLAESLGLDALEWNGKGEKGAVLLVGDDTALGIDDLKAAAKRGVRSLVIANNDLAKEAGFKLNDGPLQTVIKWKTKKEEYAEDEARKMKRPTSNTEDVELSNDLGGDEFSLDEVKKEPKKARRPKGVKYCDLPDVWYAITNVAHKSMVRVQNLENFDKFPFAGIGLPLLRWRESPRPKVMSGAPKGWTLAGEGLFAISEDGMILIDQVSPYRVLDERKEAKDGIGGGNWALSLDNCLRRYSLVLENWGVTPGSIAYDRFFNFKGGDIYWSANRFYDPYHYCAW